MTLKLSQPLLVVLFVISNMSMAMSMAVGINIDFDVNEYLEYLNERQDNQERIRLAEKIPKDDSNIQVLISCPANELAQCNQNRCQLWTVEQATPIIGIESETGFFIKNTPPEQDHGSR